MTPRWLLCLAGAIVLTSCAHIPAPATTVVKHCAPAEEHFVDIVSDALDADTREAALAGLDGLAKETEACVVREALQQLFDFATKAKTAPSHREEWAAAWMAANP